MNVKQGSREKNRLKGCYAWMDAGRIEISVLASLAC